MIKEKIKLKVNHIKTRYVSAQYFLAQRKNIIKQLLLNQKISYLFYLEFIFTEFLQ